MKFFLQCVRALIKTVCFVRKILHFNHHTRRRNCPKTFGWIEWIHRPSKTDRGTLAYSVLCFSVYLPLRTIVPNVRYIFLYHFLNDINSKQKFSNNNNNNNKVWYAFSFCSLFPFNPGGNGFRSKNKISIFENAKLNISLSKYKVILVFLYENEEVQKPCDISLAIKVICDEGLLRELKKQTIIFNVKTPLIFKRKEKSSSNLI